MWVRKSITLEEAASKAGIEQTVILECIEKEWISPAEPKAIALDEEDIARVQLIFQLRQEFGVNDEGIPIILHLLDQLLNLHYNIRRDDLVSSK